MDKPARTGQGKFIVVLVDLDTHKLLGLVSKRTQSEIKKVMLKFGKKVLAQIKEVSIDMTGNYKSLVKKICPNAEITIDRFHVMKMVQEELNQARIDGAYKVCRATADTAPHQKKVAQSLNIKKRASLFNSLKGGKYILLKSQKDLSNQQAEKLK